MFIYLDPIPVRACHLTYLEINEIYKNLALMHMDSIAWWLPSHTDQVLILRGLTIFKFQILLWSTIFFI